MFNLIFKAVKTVYEEMAEKYFGQDNDYAGFWVIIREVNDIFNLNISDVYSIIENKMFVLAGVLVRRNISINDAVSCIDAICGHVVYTAEDRDKMIDYLDKGGAAKLRQLFNPEDI